MSYTDRITIQDKGINTYLDELTGKEYKIPTFQREVVWDKKNVKKLWDSIYKFYPLGSILIWKTDLRLQNHREIGGHVITDEKDKNGYRYILDGQQRTTSLLTSLYGGRIEGNPGFDPTIYIDLTIESEGDTDDESYKKRFLFWDEIDDRDGNFKANTGKKKKFDEGQIIKLNDIKYNFSDVERKIHDNISTEYDHPLRQQLRRMKEVLDNYRLSFIELKRIQVAQVCQIFERINQAGEPLDIFDIVVAKTFRATTETDNGFYLREMIEKFRETNASKFLQLDDWTYLQILAVLISKHVENSGVYNITDRYLNEIKTEHIEEVWEDAKKAILKTFDFFENYLDLYDPFLIPFRYFYMTITAYFYKNDKPNYKFLKQYFWFNSFHNEDLLSNTSHLFNDHIKFLEKEKNGETPQFERFLIDKHKLRTSSYSSRGRLSNAILSLYANHQPKDWRYTDRNVLANSLFISTDKPNLHHIFPTNYIEENPGQNKLNSNSLMNIAYLTQITNLEISDKNPLIYIKDFDKPEFEHILPTHLIPQELLEWSRMDEMPADALDQFIEKRIEIIIETLRNKINISNFEVMDTKENPEQENGEEMVK